VGLFYNAPEPTRGYYSGIGRPALAAFNPSGFYNINKRLFFDLDDGGRRLVEAMKRNYSKEDFAWILGNLF